MKIRKTSRIQLCASARWFRSCVATSTHRRTGLTLRPSSTCWTDWGPHAKTVNWSLRMLSRQAVACYA